MSQTNAPPLGEQLKQDVRAFWDSQSCGECYADGDDLRAQLDAQARARYELEPYILEFARFNEGAGKDVLEIGIGMGTDHLQWAKSHPRSLTGVDLTPRAIEFTRQRFANHNLQSNLREADAENLPFPDNSFDLVYSWGVLHHSPNTPKAIAEVHRVLRPGGTARIMIYHRHSIVGYMLWARFGLLTGRPWRSLTDVFANHLESPGTKAYTIAETQEMCRMFAQVKVRSLLSFGDLLDGKVGERRNRSLLLSTVKKLWPRWIIKTAFKNHGMQLLIEAVK